jgi:anti-sigma28 factor (negative regulator of flagellin synthesis)
MENMEQKNIGRTPEGSIGNEKRSAQPSRSGGRRPRSLTTLKLEIVSERARKMKRIKETIDMGNYKVEPRLVAETLLKNFNEDDLK